MNPTKLEWQYGDLPDVDYVPYDCRILFFGDNGAIEVIRPWGDHLNPLRWDEPWYVYELGGKTIKGWWAWIDKGTNEKRPDYVLTRKEKWGE